MHLTNRIKQAGATGYILLWLLGIPIPILFLIFLLRGCTGESSLVSLPDRKPDGTRQQTALCLAIQLRGERLAERHSEIARCVLR